MQVTAGITPHDTTVMKSEEAIRRIEFIADKTVSDWSSVMLEVASTANTMIKTRVIKKGQNAEGEQ